MQNIFLFLFFFLKKMQNIFLVLFFLVKIYLLFNEWEGFELVERLGLKLKMLVA